MRHSQQLMDRILDEVSDGVSFFNALLETYLPFSQSLLPPPLTSQSCSSKSLLWMG